MQSLASIDKDCKKFVRVSSCQRIEIQRVLELSPDGILVPQISSYEGKYTISSIKHVVDATVFHLLA